MYFAALGAVFGVLVAALALGLVGRRFSRDFQEAAPQRVPFLGGTPPPTHAWSRYHARYYPMTLLFIAFEMEMMFMYPWAVVFVEEGVKALVEMGMFLVILSLGVVYAFREGALRWQ